MSDTIVGALIGVAATLAGVLLTSRLMNQAQRKRSRAEILDCLHAVRLQLESQSYKLNPASDSALVDCSAYEVLQAKGFLRSLPSQVATSLVRTFDWLQRVNEDIEVMRGSARAVISSGKPEMWAYGEMRKELDEHRVEAAKEVNACVDLLARVRPSELRLL